MCLFLETLVLSTFIFIRLSDENNIKFVAKLRTVPSHCSYLTGLLGRLLPLSSSENSNMQNDRFSDKKSPTGKSHKGYTDGSHSEIEVAAYSDWNADTILERGLRLLDFLERRWNVKFPSDESKKDMLFLDFIPL